MSSGLRSRRQASEEGSQSFRPLRLPVQKFFPWKTNSEFCKSRYSERLQSSTMQLDQSSVTPPFCFGHSACCGGSEACVCRENRLTTDPTAPGTRGLRAKPAEGAGCRPDGLAAIALLTPFLSGFRTGCPEVSMVTRVPRSLFCA